MKVITTTHLKITYLKLKSLSQGNDELTLKHWETHGCVASTVAIDALVLKHQAISTHNAD